MKNIVTKLEKVVKSEEADPRLKQQAKQKIQAITNNKLIEK